MNAKKLHIKTFGCQMNVYDSEKITDVLRPLGYQSTPTPDDADMILLNTCHIREKAAEKLYSDLGRLKVHQDKRNAMLIVAGCVAQADGKEMQRRAPYIDVIVGPQAYHRLPELIAKAYRSRGAVLDTDFPAETKFDFLPTNDNPAAPSAFVTIQEGCDKFCHFCVVPYTRGAEYSRSVKAVLEECKSVLVRGAKEIVLLGQNVNAYHGEGPNGKTVGLGGLIRELVEKTNVARIRYMTSHPRDMDADLIKTHGDVPELMPMLHLPVQTGGDRMLAAMNRKHTANEYRRTIDALREARPDIVFSSDFIVGYPGETLDDFAATLKLVEDVKYEAASYSFAYSARPGTPASNLEDQLPDAVKKQRLHSLQELLGKQQTTYNENYVGSTQPVLFEKAGRHEGQLVGRTPHFQSVHVIGNPRLIGQIADVKMTELQGNSLLGELVLKKE